jgi:hypothetical protein
LAIDAAYTLTLWYRPTSRNATVTAPPNDPQATRRNPRCMAIRRHAQRNHFNFYSRCSQWTFVQNVSAKPISWRAEH